MSNIEKLLQGVEVEWKKLGEVCEILTGGEAPSNAIKGSTPDIINKYPIYGNGVEVYGFTDSYRIDKDAVTISSIGANTGAIYFRKAFFTPIIRLKVVIPKYDNLLPRYIFHYLTSIKISSKKSSVPNMSAADVKSIPIPIPCPDDPQKSLEIQKEIIRILDKFSTLTAELQAELQARKFQYEYYRNQLLTYPMEESDQLEHSEDCSATSMQNSDNPMQPSSTSNPHTGNSVLQPRNKVEWKTLGEIGEVCMCKRILKEQTSDTGDIPFYKIGTFGKQPNAYISKELFDEYKSKYSYPKIGEVLISVSGTIGRAVIFDGRDAYFQDSNIVWIRNDESQVLNKYLFYVYQIAKWEISEGGTIQRLYNDNLKKTRIPIPYPNDPEKSLKEQERIVSILDKFDTLTNSITEGLPKEIELRQKQYEYYRDMLLSFPKNNIKA